MRSESNIRQAEKFRVLKSRQRNELKAWQVAQARSIPRMENSQEMQSRNNDKCSAAGLRTSDKRMEMGVLLELQAAGARNSRRKEVICLLGVRNPELSPKVMETNTKLS